MTEQPDTTWWNYPFNEGRKGDDGAPGAPGAPSTLTMGTVVTGDAAAASITGTAPNYILNLTLPRGQRGYPGINGSNGTNGTNGSGVTLVPAPSGGDDTVMIQEFLEDHMGETIHFRPETYTITNTITVPSGTELLMTGTTINATGIPVAATLGQRIAFTSAGILGSDITISNALALNARVITGTTTVGIVAGDLILLTNEEQPVPGMTRTDRDKGELAIVASVDSGTQLTLATGASFSYGTTGLKYRKVYPTENVVIRDGKIILGGVGSGHNGILIRYGRNITIDGTTVIGAEDVGISLNTVYKGCLNKVTVRDSTSSATLGTSGYGVSIVEGSKHVVVDGGQFYNCRHFVAGGGYWPPLFIDIVNNHGERASNAGFDCHESTFHWTFRNNSSVGTAIGFIVRGQHIVLEGNTAVDSTGPGIKVRSFDGVTEQRGIRLIGNKVHNCVGGIEVDGITLAGEPNSLKIGPEIIGNKLLNCGANPILLRHFQDAIVSNNKVDTSTSHAILILGLSGTQSTGLVGVGNIVKNAGADGVKIQYVDDITLSAWEILNSTTNGMEILACNRVEASVLHVGVTAQNGFFIDATTKASFNGCHASGGTGATYDGMRVTGSTDITVNGGYYASLRNAIYTTTTDYVIVQGVNGRGATSGTKINVDAANKAVGNNLS